MYHVIKGSNEEQKQKVIEAIKKFQISPDILESKTDIYNSDLSRGRKGEVLRQFLEVDKIYKGKYKGGDSLSNAFSQSAIKYFMSNENWGFKISSAVRFGNVRQLYSELSLLPRLSGALEEDKYREICLAIPNLVQYINPYSETPRINLLINTLFKITKNLSGPSERYSVDEEGIRKVIVENLFAIKPLPFLAIASAFEMSQIDPFGLDISVMDIVLDEELAQGQLQSQASLLLYLLGHPNLRKDSVTEELQGKIIELCKKIPQEKSDEIYNTAFSDILVSAQEEKMFNLMKEVGFLKDRVRSITSRSATLSLLQEENAKERKEKEKVRKGVMANAIRRMEGDVASQAEDLHDSGPAHEEEIESASTSPERSVYQESYNQDSEAGEWAEVKAKESRPRRNRAYYRPLQRNKERNDLSPPIESVKKNNVRLPRVLPLTTKTWDKLPKIEDQVAMKEIMREQEVRSREHEVDVFLSGNRNISSTQDLPDFLQEIVDKILATGSQVILKGSAIYLDPNSSRKPADLDIEILIKGLSDHGEGLQEGDLQRVGDILRGLFGEDVQSLKIYRSRDDKHFTANFQAVNGKLDVSVYDSEKEPNPNLSWTTNRERRVIFDSNGDAHYDTPRGFEGYVRSVYEEFSGSREVDEEAVSQIKQSQCLFINKDARKLILRLVFLQTIGMFDEYELGEALGDFYSEGFQFDSPVNLLCSELRVDQDLAMGYADEGSRSYAIQDNVAQRIDEFMGHHCLKDTPESKYYFLYNLNTILNTQFKSVGVDESFQVYHELIKQTVYSMAHESYQDLSKPSNEVHEQAAGPLSSNSIASAKV